MDLKKIKNELSYESARLISEFINDSLSKSYALHEFVTITYREGYKKGYNKGWWTSILAFVSGMLIAKLIEFIITHFFA